MKNKTENTNKCPLCGNVLTAEGDVYLCTECNRYFNPDILDMPNKVAPTFYYELSEKDQITIAKEQRKTNKGAT